MSDDPTLLELPVDEHSPVLDRKPRLIPGPPLQPLISGFFAVHLRFPEVPLAHVSVTYWDDDVKGVQNNLGAYIPANQQRVRPQCLSIEDAIEAGPWHVLSRYYAKSIGAVPCPVCYEARNTE